MQCLSNIKLLLLTQHLLPKNIQLPPLCKLLLVALHCVALKIGDGMDGDDAAVVLNNLPIWKEALLNWVSHLGLSAMRAPVLHFWIHLQFALHYNIATCCIATLLHCCIASLQQVASVTRQMQLYCISGLICNLVSLCCYWKRYIYKACLDCEIHAYGVLHWTLNITILKIEHRYIEQWT